MKKYILFSIAFIALLFSAAETAEAYCNSSSITYIDVCYGGNCYACPKSIPAGTAVTIWIKYIDSGQDSSYKYDHRSLWKDGTRIACNKSQGADNCSETWDYFSVTLPSTAGTYTYTAKAYAASSLNDSYCNSSEGSSQSCAITTTIPCQCTSGVCCDGCNYKTSGSQPTGYTDYYDCNGSNSPTETNYVRFNDYYCNGTDASYHLSQSNVDTCGYCKYCSSGYSYCFNYSDLTACGSGKCCSGACDTSFSCSLTSGCYSETCSGTSWTCSAAYGGSACGSELGPSCRYTNTCDAWYYKNTCSSGYCTGATTWTTDATDNSACNGQTCATGKVCQNGNCITPCDSTSYTSCPSSAYDFGTSGGTKSDMCGTDQYYKVTVPNDQICDLTWTLSPNAGDYDLYAKWSSGSCPSTSSYDCSSTNGGTTADTCTRINLTAGTYYALSHQYSAGRYSITAGLSNCQTACSSLSYPPDKWQRVWYDWSANCLGDGPDETLEEFDNNWGTGAINYGLSDQIQFASSKKIYIPTTGVYIFNLGSDDGAKLIINGTTYIDDWTSHSYRVKNISLNLSAGWYNFEIHWFENTGSARVSFEYHVDQESTDCNTECNRRGDGYYGGECYQTAYPPPPFTTPFCTGYTYGNLIPDQGACSGSSVGCICCHNCPNPPVPDNVTVGSCNTVITGKGWDATDGVIFGYAGFNKDTTWRTFYMDDNPGDSTCADNLTMKNSWSVSGDAITVQTDITGKSASHNLGGGFDFNPGGCKYTVSKIGVAGNGNETYTSASACMNGTNSLGITSGADSGEYVRWLIDMEYCGDGECNCGETCTSCVGDCGSCDTTPPTSVITSMSPSPTSGWWSAGTITLNIQDTDNTGGSGLKAYPDGCKYYTWICDSGPANCQLVVNNQARTCNASIQISVGPGTSYYKEGVGTAWVRVYSVDNAGNSGDGKAGYQDDKFFMLDWTPPSTQIK